MKIFKKNLAVLLLLFSNEFVAGDLPILCDKQSNSYEGSTWTFHVNYDYRQLNLYETGSVCQHSIPNSVQPADPNEKFKFSNEEIWKVKMTDSENVIAQKCNPGQNCEVSSGTRGTWDLLFGESLVVQLDNGVRFLANMKYQKYDPVFISQKDHIQVSQSNSAQQSQLRRPDYSNFKSVCDQTMLGFVQQINGGGRLESHTIQCFYGIMNEKQSVNSFSQKPNQPQQSESAIYFLKKSLKPNIQQMISKSQLESQTVKFLSNQIESKDNQKNQFSHTNSSSHLSLSQLDQQVQSQFKSQANLQSTMQKLQALRQKYKSASEIPESEIPSSYDLRNVNGVNFMGKVRDQGRCGSCYTVAFVTLIESRLRYLGGTAPADLSVQHLLSCNYLSEACSGGWGLNHGFLMENGGLVREECAPYSGSSETPCRDFSGCYPVARVSKSYKLKNPSELDIQREILRNGAVLTDYNAPNYMAQLDSDSQYFYPPNHSSVIIGWGEGDHQEGKGKYWIIRNSRGEEFAHKGHNLSPRGYNQHQLEQDIQAFIPEFI